MTAVALARAEEFYCEAMSVEGSVTVSDQTVSGKTLSEGDILKVDDVVQVGPDSYVDLAYDSEWNNVTRLEENSSLRIRSLYPTTVTLNSGGLYAKLKSLPKESSFSVETPTAIASVRGTEYRTTFLEGQTEIYNLSESDVYVYGLDVSGQMQSSPVIIHHSEKTQVLHRGQAPVPPRRMDVHELKRAEHFHQEIEKKVNKNIAQGRFGKIQDLKAVEKARLQNRSDNLQPLVSREGEGGERKHDAPKILSGDDARQRVGSLADGNDRKLRGANSMIHPDKVDQPRNKVAGVPAQRTAGGTGQVQPQPNRPAQGGKPTARAAVRAQARK